MTIGEHIAGEVQVYDYTDHVWSKIADLSDTNVISASTRRLCCADGAFEIGGCYAATLSMQCRLPGMTRYGVKGCRILLRRWYDGEPYDATNAPLEGIFWVTDAKKVAEIFTISGQDAMGWADTSSYSYDQQVGSLTGVYGFGEFLKELYPGGGTLEWWMGKSVDLANLIAGRQTGILQDLLTWVDYDEAANGVNYCNKYMWVWNPTPAETTTAANFWLYTADGVYKDDNPRDFLRWLAQAAGGFITVTKDGNLTLRQFVQPSIGEAVVRMEHIEGGSSDVADYRLQLYYTAVMYDDVGAAAAGGAVPYGTDANGNGLTPYRIYVEGNPFINGFTGYPETRYANNLSVVYGLQASMYHYGADRNCIARPFRVKVHKAERFELGQRIRFPDWHDLGETQTHDLYSVITGVQWTLHGGTVLSCGGEDSRVMADCIRATKADKAIRELRNRFKAL